MTYSDHPPGLEISFRCNVEIITENIFQGAHITPRRLCKLRNSNGLVGIGFYVIPSTLQYELFSVCQFEPICLPRICNRQEQGIEEQLKPFSLKFSFLEQLPTFYES